MCFKRVSKKFQSIAKGFQSVLKGFPKGFKAFQKSFQRVSNQEGSRQQHRKLIDSWGYSYNVKQRTKMAVIWQCTVRKGHYCKATVKEVDGAFHETQVHDH